MAIVRHPSLLPASREVLRPVAEMLGARVSDADVPAGATFPTSTLCWLGFPEEDGGIGHLSAVSAAEDVARRPVFAQYSKGYTWFVSDAEASNETTLEVQGKTISAFDKGLIVVRARVWFAPASEEDERTNAS